jgi:hypothetical protein
MSARKPPAREGQDERAADGAGGADKPAPAANRPQRAPGTSAWLFGVKAAAATVGGGLLTLFFTIAQITYQQHLEVLDRQSEQGAQFQNQLFQTTGHIENEFIDILTSLGETPAAPVASDIHARLDQLGDQWRLARLSFRVRGAQIYGHGVGNSIYDPAEETIDLDDCNVEIQRGDRAANRDCAGRRRAEAIRLRSLVASLRGDVAQRGEAHWRPVGFQSNFRLTRKVLHAYVDCRLAAQAPAPGPANPRCDGLADTFEILTRRVDLMVLAREALSTQIMRSSALSD